MANLFVVYTGETRLIPSALTGLGAGVTLLSASLSVAVVGGEVLSSGVNVAAVQVGTSVSSSYSLVADSLGVGSYLLTWAYVFSDSQTIEDFVYANVQDFATGGGFVIPTFDLSPPLFCVRINPGTPACAPIDGALEFGIDEVGITVYVALMHTPDGPTSAPLGNAPLTVKMRAVGTSVPVTLVTQPSWVNGVFSVAALTLQGADTALLSWGLWKLGVEALLSDGQVRYFGGVDVNITQSAQ